MAAVHFYEYLCKCGQYLFKNCDIIHSSTKYIFVDQKNLPIYYTRNKSAKCNNCHMSVGGFCHLINVQRDTTRFCKHLIIRKTKRLCIYRVIDKNGFILPNEFETAIV